MVETFFRLHLLPDACGDKTAKTRVGPGEGEAAGPEEAQTAPESCPFLRLQPLSTPD